MSKSELKFTDVVPICPHRSRHELDQPYHLLVNTIYSLVVAMERGLMLTACHVQTCYVLYKPISETKKERRNKKEQPPTRDI